MTRTRRSAALLIALGAAAVGCSTVSPSPAPPLPMAMSGTAWEIGVRLPHLEAPGSVPLGNGSIASTEDMRDLWTNAAVAALRSSSPTHPFLTGRHGYSNHQTVLKRIRVLDALDSALPACLEFLLFNSAEGLKWIVRFDLDWPMRGEACLLKCSRSKSRVIDLSFGILEDPWNSYHHESVLREASRLLFVHLTSVWSELDVAVPTELTRSAQVRSPRPSRVSHGLACIRIRATVAWKNDPR